MTDSTTSTQYFKTLTNDGRGGISDYAWPLPQNGQPGAWTEPVQDVSLCSTGYHFTDTHGLLYWLNNRIFLFEARDNMMITDYAAKFGEQKFACSCGRLVRELALPATAVNALLVDMLDCFVAHWVRDYLSPPTKPIDQNPVTADILVGVLLPVLQAIKEDKKDRLHHAHVLLGDATHHIYNYSSRPYHWSNNTHSPVKVSVEKLYRLLIHAQGCLDYPQSISGVPKEKRRYPLTTEPDEFLRSYRGFVLSVQKTLPSLFTQRLFHMRASEILVQHLTSID